MNQLIEPIEILNKTKTKMNKYVTWFLTGLRMLVGWHFLYEGIAKLATPGWSAEFYLKGSNWIFSGFFHQIADSPALLKAVDLLNIWGLILIGLSLSVGFLVRWSSIAGALLLLAVSLLPEAPVYVAPAEKPAAASATVEALPAAAWPAPVIRPTKTRPESAPVASRAVPATAAPAAAPEKKPAVPAPQQNQAMPATLKTATAMPLPKPVPVAAPVPEAISAEEAEALLQQYQAHYSAGNLAGLMALFSPKAISLQGGRDAIAADYSRLFTGTRQRSIALRHPRWEAVEDTRRLRAGFQTESVFAAGRAPQRRSGSLEILLVRENGKPRILELLMTE